MAACLMAACNVAQNHRNTVCARAARDCETRVRWLPPKFNTKGE